MINFHNNPTRIFYYRYFSLTTMYKLWQQRRRFCSHGQLKQLRYVYHDASAYFFCNKIASTCAFIHIYILLMFFDYSSMLDIKDEVHEAIINKRAIVALESTIITHGMPHPENLNTAIEVEKIVREQV